VTIRPRSGPIHLTGRRHLSSPLSSQRQAQETDGEGRRPTLASLGRFDYGAYIVTEQIKKRLENGFAPFALRLSDGRRFVVPHRDVIAVSPKVVVVIGEDELAVSISPIHIVSVDDLAPTQ